MYLSSGLTYVTAFQFTALLYRIETDADEVIIGYLFSMVLYLHFMHFMQVDNMKLDG